MSISRTAALVLAIACMSACRTDDAPAFDPGWRDRVSVAAAPGDIVLGSDDALVEVVAFIDYRCHPCMNALDDLDALRRTQPDDLRLVIKWSGDPEDHDGLRIARAAWAAHAQGHWDAFRRSAAVYLDGRDVADDDLRARAVAAGCDRARFDAAAASDTSRTAVLAGADLAEALDVHTEPTLFVNGRRVVGMRGKDVLSSVIATELRLARTTARELDLTAAELHAGIAAHGRHSTTL